jgi:hypothetical protein
MQTCVGSVAGMAFSGGFGSYLIAMDQQTYQNLGSTRGNLPSVRARTHSSSINAIVLGPGILALVWKLHARGPLLPACQPASGVWLTNLHHLPRERHESMLSDSVQVAAGHACKFESGVHARAQDVYNPELWRTIPYLLCISLIGIFVLLSLRKRFVVDYGLPYPSSMASGVLINSLHSIGNKTAARQARGTPETPTPLPSCAVFCLSCKQIPPCTAESSKSTRCTASATRPPRGRRGEILPPLPSCAAFTYHAGLSPALLHSA